MPFRTNCDNKGCRKDVEPLLDKETNTVFCPECDGEIKTVDEFMKRQMVTMGQVKRNTGRRMPYSVECQSCKKHNTPAYVAGKIVCPSCKKEHTHLSAPFIQLLKANLPKS